MDRLKLTAQSKEYLALLRNDSNFLRLMQEMQDQDLFAEQDKLRWSPESKVSNKARIYNDGLHVGRGEVLSIFRGEF